MIMGFGEDDYVTGMVEGALPEWLREARAARLKRYCDAAVIKCDTCGQQYEGDLTVRVKDSHGMIHILHHGVSQERGHRLAIHMISEFGMATPLRHPIRKCAVVVVVLVALAMLGERVSRPQCGRWKEVACGQTLEEIVRLVGDPNDRTDAVENVQSCGWNVTCHILWVFPIYRRCVIKFRAGIAVSIAGLQ